MTDIQPIYGIPALRVDDSFVISDLHIGVEAHLMKKGFHLVSRTEEMFDCIMENSEGCNRLIVLGDVKDSVPGSSKQEYREIPDFFRRLQERFERIDIVRGNHDTSIEEFLPLGVRVRPSTGVRVGDVGYVHGHTWPSEDVMKSDTLIMAHEHPAVMFKDGVGKQTSEPCWVRGRFLPEVRKFESIPKDFIIVPAFNRMLGGSPVNVNGGSFLNPLINGGFLDMDNAELYLLDGIDLGRRSDLMVSESNRRR